MIEEGLQIDRALVIVHHRSVVCATMALLEVSFIHERIHRLYDEGQREVNVKVKTKYLNDFVVVERCRSSDAKNIFSIKEKILR